MSGSWKDILCEPFGTDSEPDMAATVNDEGTVVDFFIPELMLGTMFEIAPELKDLGITGESSIIDL